MCGCVYTSNCATSSRTQNTVLSITVYTVAIVPLDFSVQLGLTLREREK